MGKNVRDERPRDGKALGTEEPESEVQDVIDIETFSRAFAVAGDKRLLAQVHQPQSVGERTGKGIVMVHGGAWTSNDRLSPHVLCDALARRGLTVFSLDFRDGRTGRHPCAVQDITAGIRFVRLHADEFGIDAKRIGLVGSSSGGHLVLLAAAQPDVPEHRGTAVVRAKGVDSAKEVSAEVACVVALWPVSDPLVRFQHAHDTGREELVAAHLKYYNDEGHMHQASVQRMLAAGEAQVVPPLLVVQPGEDRNVPQPMTLDLLREWQNAGGALHYLFYPGLPHAFAYEASAETTQLERDIWPFLDQHLAVGAS